MKDEKPLDRHNERQSRLAQLLLDGRIAAGLMQTEAAQRIGVSPTYLGRLERGEYSNPSPRILMATAEIYKMSQADLFEAAGYLTPSELPTLASYLHATCEGLPDSEIKEIVDFCDFVKKRHEGN
jgi:transcriptional regulator with XRE-family HTH domain